MNYQGTWAANRNIMAVLASAAASAGRCPKQLRYLGKLIESQAPIEIDH